MQIDVHTVERLHETWCNTTGVPLPLTMCRRYMWEDWLRVMASDFPKGGKDDPSPQDVLRLVLLRRRKLYADKPAIQSAMMRFNKVVGSPDECLEDYLQQAAENRPRPSFVPDKRSVLRATGRPDEPEQPQSKPAAAVVDAFLVELRNKVRR